MPTPTPREISDAIEYTTQAVNRIVSASRRFDTVPAEIADTISRHYACDAGMAMSKEVYRQLKQLGAQQLLDALTKLEEHIDADSSSSTQSDSPRNAGHKKNGNASNGI